jgi:hypothetical protein
MDSSNEAAMTTSLTSSAPDGGFRWVHNIICPKLKVNHHTKSVLSFCCISGSSRRVIVMMLASTGEKVFVKPCFLFQKSLHWKFSELWHLKIQLGWNLVNYSLVTKKCQDL